MGIGLRIFGNNAWVYNVIYNNAPNKTKQRPNKCREEWKDECCIAFSSILFSFCFPLICVRLFGSNHHDNTLCCFVLLEFLWILFLSFFSYIVAYRFFAFSFIRQTDSKSCPQKWNKYSKFCPKSLIYGIYARLNFNNASDWINCELNFVFSLQSKDGFNCFDSLPVPLVFGCSLG